MGTGRAGDAFQMAQFGNLAQEGFDRMIALQKKFLDAAQDMNLHLVAGMNAEAALVSELFAKLTAAKSIPDAASACQECGSRQMEILAEQNRKLMAAAEKLIPRPDGNGCQRGGS